MNDGLVIDHLGKVNHSLNQLNKLLALIYYQTQESKAQETPGAERPYIINLQCPTSPEPQALQIVPNNGARQKVGIYNLGPNDLLLSNKYFDPGSILQQISDPAYPNQILPGPNQVVEIGILPRGASCTWYSTASIWGYNVGNSGNQRDAPSNCVLSILESLYVTPKSVTGMKPYGVDGATHGGYGVTPNADPSAGVVVSKRLV